MNEKVLNWQEAYWYARGYHDGRVIGDGVQEGYDAIKGRDHDETQANQRAYKHGYDTGVADYADLDIYINEKDI